MKYTLGFPAPFLAAILIASSLNAPAQTTAFNYQGRLNDGGQSATGIYDLQFTVFDASTNGNAVSSVLTNSATSVNNGLFSISLDFGNVFDGGARWLDLAVRTNGSAGAFTELWPRQQITSAPYAIQSLNAASATVAASANAVSATNISGTISTAQLPATMLTNGASGASLSGSLSGTFNGDGSGLTNLNSAKLTGTIQVSSSGDVAINASPANSATVIVRANTNDLRLFMLENPAGTPVLKVQTNGEVGVNQAYTDTTLNVRGSASDKSYMTIEQTNGSDLLVVRSSGNVGVGMSDPQYALDVNGTARATLFSGDGSGLTNFSTTNLTGTISDSQLSSNVALLNAATNAFTGRIGIGTASPQGMLHIVGAGQYAAELQGSSTVGTWLTMNNTTTGGHTWSFVSTGSGNGEGVGKLLIRDESAGVRAQFDTSGNLGVGYADATVYRAKVDVNGDIRGSNIVATGTFSGNGGGLTNTTTAANYVFAYDTTSQSVISPLSYQDITLNNNGQINGWTHAAGSASFTCGQGGLYLVQYSGEAEVTSGATVNCSLEAVLNSIEIAGSQCVTSLTGNSTPFLMSKSFITSVSAGDVLRFQVVGGSTNVKLTTGFGTGDTKPSFSVSIVRIQ